MYYPFLIFVLLSPIPFGANRPWAWSLCAVLFAVCGLVFFIQVLLNKRTINLNYKGLKIATFFWLSTVIWVLIQCSSLTPISWNHPFWKLAAEQLSIPITAHISTDIHESYTALMRLLSYALVFFLSLQFNRDADKAAFTFKAIAYSGLAYAVYGIVIYLGHFDTILWFDKWVGQNVVTSTFVNRNSYATYAGLSLLATIPLLFNAFKSSLKYGLSSNFGRDYFYEHVLIKGWFPLLMGLTIFSALLMSQSRGGFLSTLLAIFIFVIILLVSRKIQKKTGLISLVILLTVISWVLFAKNYDVLIDRLDALDVESEGRASVYKLLSKVSSDNSALGLGYGTFENSFRLYRDESITSFYDKAHNTYLENIFELGYLQAVSLFLSIACLAISCLHGVWIRKRNWLYSALAVAASVLVGAHAFVDFSLQIPAIAYTYALILGVGVAQSSSSRKISAKESTALNFM